MEISLLQTLVGSLIIILIDSIYLNLNKDFYKPIMDPGVELNITAGIICWIIIIIAIQLLVLSRPDVSESNVFIYGAILCFAMYGVYNMTNYATYPHKWNPTIAIGDTAWGSLITGSMAYILLKIGKI